MKIVRFIKHKQNLYPLIGIIFITLGISLHAMKKNVQQEGNPPKITQDQIQQLSIISKENEHLHKDAIKVMTLSADLKLLGKSNFSEDPSISKEIDTVKKDDLESLNKIYAAEKRIYEIELAKKNISTNKKNTTIMLLEAVKLFSQEFVDFSNLDKIKKAFEEIVEKGIPQISLTKNDLIYGNIALDNGHFSKVIYNPQSKNPKPQFIQGSESTVNEFIIPENFNNVLLNMNTTLGNPVAIPSEFSAPSWHAMTLFQVRGLNALMRAMKIISDYRENS